MYKKHTCNPVYSICLKRQPDALRGWFQLKLIKLISIVCVPPPSPTPIEPGGTNARSPSPGSPISALGYHWKLPTTTKIPFSCFSREIFPRLRPKNTPFPEKIGWCMRPLCIQGVGMGVCYHPLSVQVKMSSFLFWTPPRYLANLDYTWLLLSLISYNEKEGVRELFHSRHHACFLSLSFKIFFVMTAHHFFSKINVDVLYIVTLAKHLKTICCFNTAVHHPCMFLSKRFNNGQVFQSNVLLQLDVHNHSHIHV